MPRHQITNALASGLGDQCARAQKVKPGKSNIWDSSVVHAAVRPTTTSTSDSAAITPEIELLRMSKVMQLRKQIRKLRVQHGPQTAEKYKPAVMALERWFMRYQLQLDRFQTTNSNSSSTDPLVPQLSVSTTDAGLVSDLQAAGDSSELATLVASKLHHLANQYALDIQTHTKSGTQKVKFTQHKHTMDITCDKQLFKLNPAHYAKLKCLYQRSGGKETVFVEEEFHRHVFSLLCRYHAIQGHGFQAAMPEQAFDVLHQELGVDLECFASPLNCRFGAHCSAFADTDVRFGSVGSFFKFHPTEGSFQSNPPFELQVMLSMALHIEHLLTDATGPMSFCIVVPGWTDCEAWKVLLNSEFKQQMELIAKADHGFCDGAQHQRRDRYRDSPYDTAIFFLQNPKGSVKWPVTKKKVQLLRNAMAQGVPSTSMRARQVASGKGTADECRGVYQGKNKNKTGEGVMKRKRDELQQKKKNKSRTK